MGLTFIMKYNIGYTYMLEFLPDEEAKYTGILFFTEGLLIIATPISLYFITKDLDFLMYIGFAVNLISFLIMLFVPLPESIQYNLKEKHYEKVRNDIAIIHRFNKATYFEN